MFRQHDIISLIAFRRAYSTGIDWLIGLMPYGPVWRAHRRALWQHIRPAVVPTYHPVQRTVTRMFLLDLFHEPEDLKQHVRL